MRVRYLKKARDTLTGRCSFDPEQICTGDNELEVTITGASGSVVMDAVITVLISERKAA